jgi:hypothetical protein
MRIVVTNFGGLVPKAQARALPDNAAQTANNITATTKEFRPHAMDLTVVANSGVTNPLGLYRLARKSDGSLNSDYTTGWIVDSLDVSYVKSPLNDNLKEWTYKSFNDGSAPPRVIDVDGGNRQLGVPTPSAAPTAATNAVAQFSVTDRSTGVDAAIQQSVNSIKGHLVTGNYGAAVPGGGGYFQRTVANGFTPANANQQVRVYRLAGAGSTISNSYCSIDGSNFSWVFDPSLTPFTVTLSGNPHIALAYPAYGTAYGADATPMASDLASLLMPGKIDGTKFYTSGQVTALMLTITNYLDPAQAPVAGMLAALNAKAAEVQGLLDGGSIASLQATTQAFYSKTDVAAALTSAIAAAAESFWQAADSIVHSGAYRDYF